MTKRGGLDVTSPPSREGITPAEIITIVLSGIWLLATAIYFWFLPPVGSDGQSLQFVMTVMAIFLPVAVIWVAAAASRSARIVREESRRLQAAVDGLRNTYLEDRKRALAVEQAGRAAPLSEQRPSRGSETVVATFSSSRAAARPKARPVALPKALSDQPTLALGTTAEEISPPLARHDFLQAINFPDNENDEDGFAALRRALKDRNARQLIQASQDVLTLLSQDGIYMDDLTPDHARPEVWRSFAKGERGRPVAALGGVRDRSCLALISGRMREDTIFRDAAYHFLRLFDNALISFEMDASDEELELLSQTRTARAFMLIGRVSGTFD
ncbi:MAG: hypothetical protein JKX69_15550 [Rhodobacteraceae bacterium]|nr:hypothetical protein [Paracoccaceae bacterium]